MAIDSTNRRNDYLGNGTQDTYDYGFKIFDQSDLVVTVRNPTTDVETTLTLTTDYTVTGVGDKTGGSITLVDGGQDWIDESSFLAEDWALTIRRVRSLKQETSIRNQGSFHPEIYEDALDHLVMVDQQQQEEIDRAVKLPETISTSDFDPSLPANIVGASGKVIVTTEDGDGFELGPSVEEIQAAEGYAEAAEAARLEAEAAEAAAANAVTDAQTAQAAAEAAQAAAEAAQEAAEDAASSSWLPYVEHSITAGQSATALAGETWDAEDYTSVVYDFEIIRGTTINANGTFVAQLQNGSWRVKLGAYMGDIHGVTFSLTGTTTQQLNAAVNAGSNGTIKLSRRLIPA